MKLQRHHRCGKFRQRQKKKKPELKVAHTHRHTLRSVHTHTHTLTLAHCGRVGRGVRRRNYVGKTEVRGLEDFRSTIESRLLLLSASKGNLLVSLADATATPENIEEMS